MSQVLQQCLGPTANTGKLGFYILSVCEVHVSLYRDILAWGKRIRQNYMMKLAWIIEKIQDMGITSHGDIKIKVVEDKSIST